MYGDKEFMNPAFIKRKSVFQKNRRKLYNIVADVLSLRVIELGIEQFEIITEKMQPFLSRRSF